MLFSEITPIWLWLSKRETCKMHISFLNWILSHCDTFPFSMWNKCQVDLYSYLAVRLCCCFIPVSWSSILAILRMWFLIYSQLLMRIEIIFILYKLYIIFVRITEPDHVSTPKPQTVNTSMDYFAFLQGFFCTQTHQRRTFLGSSKERREQSRCWKQKCFFQLY